MVFDATKRVIQGRGLNANSLSEGSRPGNLYCVQGFYQQKTPCYLHVGGEVTVERIQADPNLLKTKGPGL